MNEEKKLAYIVCTITAITFFLLGWYLHPDTKEVDFTALKANCIKMDGRISFTDGLPFCDAKHEEKVISVLAEKKECEEKGGKLDIVKEHYENEYDFINHKLTPMKITCTKPSETIFSYELTN